MVGLIKKHKIFFGILIIVFLYIGVKLLEKDQQTPQTPSTTTENQATYESLSPGKSTKDEFIKALGDPLSAQGNKLTFKSNSPERHHEALLEENKVSFFKEIVTLKDEKKIDDIKNEFGEPDNTLYGPGSLGGFDLFVYAEKGLAYVGQQESGVLLEVWYFAPTSFEEFKRKYANPD